ncbi:MAG: hypothetical protein AW08_00366 [Candidatus Accumulibacter adjunctus]|uniref:Uncharacterized protein n=1 Tax=Candidatus Accumulibacter adjunctus TaxID=1454001 RepID=A0A011PS33_9PROT|nr:MAG: hypothetical protein AW08_00366 [Candidatus Accumulibacter adjunctus]
MNTSACRLSWCRLHVLLVTALLALAACTNHVPLPGSVRYGAVSPSYTVLVENATGGATTVLPSEFGRAKGFPQKVLPSGDSLALSLQVRRFGVGSDDHVGSHQVLDSPYLDQDGANTAVARLRHADELYELVIDLESERWFDALTASTAQATTLPIRLTDFRSSRWVLCPPEGNRPPVALCAAKGPPNHPRR